MARAAAARAAACRRAARLAQLSIGSAAECPCRFSSSANGRALRLRLRPASASSRSFVGGSSIRTCVCGTKFLRGCGRASVLVSPDSVSRYSTWNCGKRGRTPISRARYHCIPATTPSAKHSSPTSSPRIVAMLLAPRAHACGAVITSPPSFATWNMVRPRGAPASWRLPFARQQHDERHRTLHGGDALVQRLLDISRRFYVEVDSAWSSGQRRSRTIQ